jgi:hypothetical protein
MSDAIVQTKSGFVSFHVADRRAMQPQPLTTLEINSVGPPPERHASRIISAMLSHLAVRHAATWGMIHGITKDPHSRDGHPKAQKKLELRVKAAGAAWTKLTPGKRGRYRLSISSWVGWSPNQDKRLTIDAEIPEKPWITLDHHVVEGKGRGWVSFSSRFVVFITTHSLVRTCQRWKVKTLADIEMVINSIAAICLDYISKAEGAGDDDWCSKIPPDGIRLRTPRNGPTLICKKHDKYHALVVVTVI